MKSLIIGYIVLLILLIAIPLCFAAEAIPDDLAIRAIIGEASSEGYPGMIAVACAIRNRGHLRGVYGLKAKHVDNEPQWVWDMARQAWRESTSTDIVRGATHWENLAFGAPYWAKSMEMTVKIGVHTFYK